MLASGTSPRVSIRLFELMVELLGGTEGGGARRISHFSTLNSSTQSECQGTCGRRPRLLGREAIHRLPLGLRLHCGIVGSTAYLDTRGAPQIRLSTSLSRPSSRTGCCATLVLGVFRVRLGCQGRPRSPRCRGAGGGPGAGGRSWRSRPSRRGRRPQVPWHSLWAEEFSVEKSGGRHRQSPQQHLPRWPLPAPRAPRLRRRGEHRGGAPGWRPRSSHTLRGAARTMAKHLFVAAFKLDGLMRLL